MADVMSDISVLICTRDRPEVLRPCVESILSGSLPPSEVVIVDQSANGGTAKVAREVSSSSTVPIRYIKLESEGHTRARNAGVKACRGKVIAFTDDDCVAASDWLAHIAREFSDPSVDCVCGTTLPEAHKERPKQALISTMQCTRRRVLRKLGNPVTVGRGNNMALRKSDLLMLGGFNEYIGVGTNIYAGDDIDLFYRLLAASCTVVQNPDAIVFHRQPNDWASVTRKKRGYAISISAVLGCRARQGDPVATVLLAGKILYELTCLLCGGLFRLNKHVAAIGWHSLMGSLSGLRHTTNEDLNEAISLFSFLAAQHASAKQAITPLDTQPCEPPQ